MVDIDVEDATLVTSFEYERRDGDQDRVLLLHREETASVDLTSESTLGIEPEWVDPLADVGTYGAIEAASIYREAGSRYIEQSWADGGPTGNEFVNRQIRRDEKEAGKALSTSYACSLLEEGVNETQSRVDDANLELQKAAFSTYGEVPPWAYTESRLRERLRDAGLGERAEYGPKDFKNLRWFRLALDNNSVDITRRMVQRAQESGRRRKAAARVPGGLSSRVFQQALRETDATDKPPEKRLTWLALARGYRELAETLRRATTYRVRKVARMWREDRAERTGEPKKSLYLNSEDTAMQFLGWLADAENYEEEDVSRRSGLETWYRVSERYHRELRQRQRIRNSRRVLKGSGYRKGPKAIDPPEDATQLRTPQEVVEEGRRMSHCVDGYAERVVKGKSLIFHYESGQEHATIEVRPGNSRYIQAYGPGNRENKASREGKKAFRKWECQTEPATMDIGAASGVLNTLEARKDATANAGLRPAR